MFTTDIEIAWLAGIFDGEGCITLTLPPKSNHHICRVSMCNTDLGIIDEVERILGELHVFYCKGEREPDGVRKKKVWNVEVNRQLEAKFLLEKLLPYLKGIEKREKAVVFIQHIDNRKRKDGKVSNRRKRSD